MILRVIDTAALREKRIKVFDRLQMASCQALNKLRSAQEAYEFGEGTLADVRRARAEKRKADKAKDAAEIAAYGLEEKHRSDAEIEALAAELQRAQAEYLASPEYRQWAQKAQRDYENLKNHGARPTQHPGFTIIDGSRS